MSSALKRIVADADVVVSLAERTYRELKRQIITGELPPGSSIMEGALAAQFGVSKTPVREALQRLELERLTRVLPRVGYVVAPVSIGDVQALFEIRLLLEPEAADLAADRIKPRQLAELDALARVSFAGADRTNYVQFLEVNTRFHLGVVAGAGNDRLTTFLGHLLTETERVLHMAVELRDSTDAVISDHVEIAEAIRMKDGARARRISARHLLASRERVLQAILSGRGLGLLVSGSR